MENQKAKLDYKKIILISLGLLVLVGAGVAIGVLVGQKNAQDSEIKQLKSDIAKLKTEKQTALNSLNESRVKQSEENKIKKFIGTGSSRLKVDYPETWTVAENIIKDQSNGRTLGKTVAFSSPNKFKLILDDADGPQVGGICTPDSGYVSARKLANTKIPGLNVVEIDWKDGEGKQIGVFQSEEFGERVTRCAYAFSGIAKLKNSSVSFGMIGKIKSPINEKDRSEIVSILSSLSE